MSIIKLTPPLTDAVIASLHAGDRVIINGTMYTARDAAHKRMVEAIKNKQPLPIDIKGQIIYYVGPTPPKPGQVIGSAGPTTSLRMDSTIIPLLAMGLKASVGKGSRNKEVREALVKYKAVYLAATGGAGAFLAKRIKKVELVAYEDLGTEAIRKLTVEDFPAFVINDIYGKDFYEIAKEKYAIKS